VAELGTVPTLDPSLLPLSLGTLPGSVTEMAITPGGPTLTPAASATDKSGCPTYTLKQGDIAGSIATNFGVSLADLMRANQLTEADLTRLQIGQVLIIPVNGCGLATEEPSPTPTRFVVPTLPPTVTAMPTASKSLLEIVQVISPGDITAEGVELHNVSGGVIQMQGWKLIDTSGLTFTFPEYRMFPGGHVTIYTRAGTNTPIVLYWGQSRAVWGEPGQEVQIIDAQGTVQASRPVSDAAETAQPSDLGPFVPTATGVS
jgi:LysM repeat protein